MPKSIPSKTHDLATREPELYARMCEHKRRISAIADKSEREAAIDATVELGDEGACRFVRNSEHDNGEPQYIYMARSDYKHIAATTFEFEKLKLRCDGHDNGNRYVKLKGDITLSPRKLINAIRQVRAGRDIAPTQVEVQEVIRLLRLRSRDLDDSLGVSNRLNLHSPEVEPEIYDGHPSLHKTLPLREDTERDVTEREARYAAFLKDGPTPGGPGSQKRAQAIRDDGVLKGYLKDDTPIAILHLTGHPLTDPDTGEVDKITPFVVLHPEDVPWIAAVLVEIRGEDAGPVRWALLGDRSVKIQCERSILLARAVWKLHHGEPPPGHVVSGCVDQGTGQSNPLLLWESYLLCELPGLDADER